MTYTDRLLAVAERMFETYGYIPTDLAFRLAALGIDVEALF